MKATNSLRARSFRFLSERFYYRERPAYSAELFLWGLVVILASWPMWSVAAAIGAMK
jgi:hypothetical protein